MIWQTLTIRVVYTAMAMEDRFTELCNAGYSTLDHPNSKIQRRPV
jgi:hypothetical protein